MPHRVKLQELMALESEQREAELTALMRASREAPVAPVLEARIRQFEVRYEMSSAEVRERLRAGTIKETADIATWLFLLEANDLCAA